MLLFMLSILFIFAKSLADGDLEVVGSDNHFVYETRIGEEEQAGIYGRNLNFKPEFETEDAPRINFPVKTVQKFTDSDGNVKIVTSYSQRDETPLPIYKNVQSRTNGIQRAKGSTVQVEEPEKFMVVKPKFVGHIEPRNRPSNKELSTTTTVQLPNDGRLYSNQRKTESTDGTRSSYNQKSSYSTKYKKPGKGTSNVGTVLPEEDKLVNVPLEEAGSSYVPEVDTPGVVEESDIGVDGYEGGEGYSEGVSGTLSGSSSDFGGGEIYEGAGESDGGQYGHHVGGLENHGSSHGHEYKKGHGESQHHGSSASKGDQGGKGFKKNEQYHKGHAESHGREEEKGGNKEESGIKKGNLDEGSHYAKGHEEIGGKKSGEQGHSKGHKKGHKTKGFRTVHHKDEYKKDEVFYDEEHDAGHSKGHGQDHHAHQHAKGGNTKKGHLQSGYKNAQKGFEGDKEKGHSYQNAKGQSGSHGGQQYHGHQSHHDKGGGHKAGESHGHEHYSKGH